MAKDTFKPTVRGVGILGTATRKGNERAYGLWTSMLCRVYDRLSYPTYVGCSVDERWHRLDFFLEDLPRIPGYTDWLDSPGFCLDKDTRVRGNKHYSLETCAFITSKANSLEMYNRYKEEVK